MNKLLNTKTYTILVVSIFLCCSLSSVSQSFEWAKQMGGSGDDYGTSIVVDDSGNVYTMGCFHDTVDFDPGTGTCLLVSLGGYDIFIQKLS